MANQASGAEDPVDAESLPGLRDAQMLKEAMHEAISESPEAFFMTTGDLKAKEPDYWEREIRSATWAVIERGDEVVGFAAARWPDGEKDRDVDPVTARFVESVWIAPELRGKRLAERLVRFLFEVECAKAPGIGRFLLWVFDSNHTAIRLYERMGFKYVARQDLVERGATELGYEYQLEPDNGGVRIALDARRDDLRKYGVTYRVLGEDTG